MKHRRILFVGYGTIAQALTPVLFALYPDLDPHNVSAITADERGAGIAHAFGIGFSVHPLTKANLHAALEGRLGPGDLMLNLSVEVATVALIDWCQQHGVLYLDTCVEPWAGGYDQTCHPAAHTTNYWLRQEALRRKARGKSTCVVAHGANPGLVSHFVKLALSELAANEGLAPEGPPAALARALGVKAIHIAERDTQTDAMALREGEFANTWSVDGLMTEAMQYAELVLGNARNPACGRCRAHRHCTDGRRHARPFRRVHEGKKLGALGRRATGLADSAPRSAFDRRFLDGIF